MTFQRLGPTLLALIIGLTSGTLAYLINMPLPWMLGSMLGVTVAAMSGAPIKAPARLRPIVIPIIGVMLGSSITAEVLSLLGQWAQTLLILPVVLIVSGGISFFVYRRFGGYDPTTAFYSSMPGGLNEMLLMDLVDHRRGRETAILAALSAKGATIHQITARVYSDTPASLIPAAHRNVLAHLIDLEKRNLVRAHPSIGLKSTYTLA